MGEDRKNIPDQNQEQTQSKEQQMPPESKEVEDQQLENERRSNWKKSYTILLVVLLLAAAIILAVVVFAKISNKVAVLEKPIQKQKVSKEEAESQDRNEKIKQEEKSINNQYIYKNQEHGFSLTFPEAWKGYKVEEDKTNMQGEVAFFRFYVPTSDDKWSGKLDGYADPISVGVYELSSLEYYEGLEGPHPTAMLKNDKYFYSMSYWQDVPSDFRDGQLDFGSVNDSFKFVETGEQKYINEKYKIQFTYPFSEKEMLTENGIKFEWNEEGYEGEPGFEMEFRAMKTEDAYVNSVARNGELTIEKINNRAGGGGTTEIFEVGGYEAVRYQNLGICDGPEITIFTNDFVYNFSRHCGGFDELNQIVESIKIL